MSQTITLTDNANEEFQVSLDGQDCYIHLYQRGDRMYMDLTADDVEIFKGCVCVHKSDVGQFESPYFKGMLVFYDNLGDDAPQYDELESRYTLIYYTEDEIEEMDSDTLKVLR